MRNLRRILYNCAVSHQSSPHLENVFPRLASWNLLRAFSLVFLGTTHFSLSSSCFLVYVVFRDDENKQKLVQTGWEPTLWTLGSLTARGDPQPPEDIGPESLEERW